MRTLLLATALGATLLANSAQAAIRYAFVTPTATAVFISPSFVTPSSVPFPGIAVPLSDIISCIGCASPFSISLYNYAGDGGIQLFLASSAAVNDYFTYAQWGTVGTYSGAGPNTLNVAPAPEPASMALLGAGLLGLAAARRRRG